MGEPNGTRLAAYEEFFDKLADPREAFDTAKMLIEKEGNNDIRFSKYHGGLKRHPGYGKYVIRTLDGVDYQKSCKIRQVVGLRYTGYPDTQIEKVLGLHNRWIWKNEIAHPGAFEQAKSELIKNALDEYHTNVAFARAAVSEMGFKALETLFLIMNDPNERGAVRLKAAEKVLSLTFGGGPSEATVAGDVINKMGDALSKIVTASKGGEYIHDAESVEWGTDECNVGDGYGTDRGDVPAGSPA